MKKSAKTRAYKETTAQQLRSFFETARLGSFTAAAIHLGLANPTVWQQVRALERDLGEPLFEPQGRNCRLTEAGQTLAELAGPLVSGITSLKRRFHEARARGARLVVATTPRILAEDLPECVQGFQRRHPDVRLHLKELADEQVHAAVEAGKADLGIILNRGANLEAPWTVSRWLEFEPLYELDIVLITPRNHPLARRRQVRPKDLLSYPLVNTLQSLPTATVVAVLDKIGMPEVQQPLVETNFTASIRRYVELGFGIGLVAVLANRQQARILHERDMSRYFGRATVYQVRRQGSFPTPAAIAFTAILKERFGRRPNQRNGDKN
jgi:DNA-binding transcriptional LysR family regulator